MSAAEQPFRWRGDAVLFDLFGTVVHFRPAVPAVEVAGTRWRSSMGWLRETAARELPEAAFDDLLAALMAVTEEIVRGRPPEYREVPSAERFRRALLRLGVGAQRALALAERLSLAHMAHLAAQTALPPTHAAVLSRLAARCRLALVSNFDHGPTARRVLAEHGVARFFEAIVISAEVGRRKPHPEIFRAALSVLGVHPQAALYVGDSLDDDVAGARNAGLSVLWLNAQRQPLRAGVPAPDGVIAALDDLTEIVA